VLVPVVLVVLVVPVPVLVVLVLLVVVVQGRKDLYPLYHLRVTRKVWLQ